MKKSIYALMILGALPSVLSAAGCTTCGQGKNYERSYGRMQKLSSVYEYDAKQHQGSADHYVTQDDKRIVGEIRNAIESAYFEHPSDVQIFVEYGKVILEGKTQSNPNRQAAEDAASKITGVRVVVNGLYVDNRNGKKGSSNRQAPAQPGTQS